MTVGRTIRQAAAGAGAALNIGLLTWPQTAGAHEKWFYKGEAQATQWGKLFHPPGVMAITVVLVLVGLALLLWRHRQARDLLPGPEAFGARPDGRIRFYALVPVILGIHLSLPLIVFGIQGKLFSPNNQLSGAWYYWLGVAQIGLGLSFLYGVATRVFSALLALLWTLGIGVVGLEPMLENLHYLGFAAFFFLAGRGRYAMDRLLLPNLEPPAYLIRRALPSLRVGMGLGLLFVALTEKLANPELAKAFLQQYRLNFTPALGMPMSDEVFILCAGAAELLIGLFLVLGLFPRLVILTAWVFINMTLTVFSWVELTGHLPIYGGMAVLLAWTPGEEDQALWARGVRGE